MWSPKVDIKEDLTKFVEYLISIGADLNITDFQVRIY